MPSLLVVESEEWRLEVVGKVTQLPPFIPLVPLTSVEIEGTATLTVFNRTTNKLAGVLSGAPIEPVFFENTDYDFYLTSRSEDVRLYLPPAASFRHRLADTSHYAANFRNDVGFVEIRVASKSGDWVVRFEVFPVKIDYRADYVEMRDEVSSIVRNLAMSVQARTFGLASPSPSRQPTLAEWLSLIRFYFKKMMAAADAITQNPHSKLERRIESVLVARSRRVDRRALTRQMRTPASRSEGVFPGTDIPMPARVPEAVHRVTFDTPENRYIKALLIETQRNLVRITRTATTGDEDADLSAEEKFFEAARPEAEGMLRQLQRILRAPFLREVAVVAANRPPSLVLLQHPHYAAFVKIARVLNGGLSLGGGLLRIGLKDIALLYEYWCFLRLVRLLGEEFELEQQSVVQVSHLRMTVVLTKGQQAAVQYLDPTSGKKLALVYNRLFRDLPTIPQRPDNIIQLAGDEKMYIFDAKYRLSFDRDYIRRYGGAGPTTDDINTMHRYRDAIVMPHPLYSERYIPGVVEGAIVLFPYPNEAKYQSHRFYKSIAQVQIGGLPFLPRNTDLVESQLRSLLKKGGYL